MLRYTSLFTAGLLISSPAMADKIVLADGDSFIEIEAQANTTPSIVDTLNPVSAAQAQSPTVPRAAARPAADVPQMHAPAISIEELLRPDYTAESFR